MSQAYLAKPFLDRIARAGLTDGATARAMGISKQFYTDVRTGKQCPTAGFMASAVHSGLAETFADVATPVLDTENETVRRDHE